MPRSESNTFVGVLSRLSGQLSQIDDVRQLAGVVHGGLQRLYAGGRPELYLAQAGDAGLVPSLDPPRGRVLLRILSGQSLAVPRLVSSTSSPRRAAILSAPLVDRGKLIGLLTLEADARRPELGYGDLDALVGVAGMVTLALSRLSSTSPNAAEQERRRYLRDLEAAREIQRQFLPSLPPEVNGFQVAAEYRPAHMVGGDFYDVVACGAGAVTAIIGDVSGKGVAAALVMSRVSSEFRRLALAGLAPADLLAKLNGSTLGTWPEDTFVTAACVRLDIGLRTLVVANAGHVLPIVVRQSGQVCPLGQEASAPLGMLADEHYVAEEHELASGDCLLLMTDGVTEALDCDGDPRRMWRICSLVAQGPLDPAAINRRILAEVDRRPASRRADDVTLLTVKATEKMRSVVSA